MAKVFVFERFWLTPHGRDRKAEGCSTKASSEAEARERVESWYQDDSQRGIKTEFDLVEVRDA